MIRLSDLAAAQAAEWHAKGHAALMRRAAVLMQHLDADDQRRLRVAMLAGVSDDLHALVSELNLRVA